MPEETQAPDAEVVETPDAPEDGSPADEGTPADQPEATDFEKRYNDLRPQWDRANQELSEFREFYGQLANPETQAEALRRLGLELESDEEEEYQDPEDALRAELDQIKGHLSEQEQARQEAELRDLEEQFLAQELGKLDANLSDKEKEVVKHLAYSYEDDDGLPNVKAALDALTGANSAARDRYLESKKAPKVEPGAAGLEKVDLSDSEARIAAAAQIMEAEGAES